MNNKDICKHPNTSVKNSRSPDYIPSSGYAAFAPLPFECLVIRRRKCLDCGVQFTTYEIRKEVISRLLIAEEIITNIKKFC